MARFVLVHGAFHGAWCWVRLIPELEKLGHRVVALDMPGMGDDRTPLAGLTFESYVDCICAALAADPEPAILVGHSLGGMAVSAAAQRSPDQVRRLVYLCAPVPRDGNSLFTTINSAELLGSHPPPGHPWDGPSQDPPLDIVEDMYYNDCSAEDIAYAKARLRTQLNAPRVTPVRLTMDRYGRVPRAFIGCSEDHAMSTERQRDVLAKAPCDPVIFMPTGHSPFFSMPAALAAHFASLAE